MRWLRALRGAAGAIEESLAAIWGEILQRRAGRPHDHFFDLGGHSLLAVQVISRVQQSMGHRVGLRDLFTYPCCRILRGIFKVAMFFCRCPLGGLIARRRWRCRGPSNGCGFWISLRGGHAYRISGALRLRGALDRAALQAALDRIVQRHEVLRTTFVNQEGTPVQIIAPAGAFALEFFDLGALALAEREEQVESLVAGTLQAPFDLAAGPLIRGCLVRLSEEDHVLCVAMHHIISDGWSIGVLIKEFAALYGAFVQGRADPLPVLEIQYADYAQWQRQWLAGQGLQEQLDYWKRHLAGAPALLELPTDRPRPSARSHAGASVDFVLDAHLCADLKALARRHGATLYMVLYSALAILLSRLSGQDDVVIGSPIAGRQRTELEGLIGFFINTLALRVDLSADPTVNALITQVKEITLEAYGHQDIPFEQVVEAVQPPRSLSHTPVFQVMFALQNLPQATLELPGLTLAPQALARQTAQFDLSLTLAEAGDQLVGDITYATDLFDRQTIERWVGHLQSVMKTMVLDADQKLGQLVLLSEAERHQVLEGFNATAASYPQDKLIHQLFEEQVLRQPQAVALVYEGQQLSYGELNGRANQLAHWLRGQGVGPDTLVAICLERSLEMVVGLLGILKAGGAYLPLDPAYPPARIAYMLEDAGPAVVLTQARLLSSLPQTRARILALDRDWQLIAASPDRNLDPAALELSPRNLAYVIYTSGSTGMPKGVMVEHRNVVAFWKASER